MAWHVSVLLALLQVYKAHLAYKAGARHGDVLEVRTHVSMESEYRAVFFQYVVRVAAGGGSGGGGGDDLSLIHI